MRSEKFVTALIGTLTAFIVSLASVACIVTGFDMAVDLWAVALWCGIAALVSGICFSLPLSPVPVCTVAVTGSILWIAGNMELSFQALVYRLSRKYNATHGWNILRPDHYTADVLELELWLFLCFLGAVIAVTIAWAICRRKTVLPGVLLSLLCLGTCFVVRETVPDTVWLWLVLFGILLLMLTHTVRRENASRGNRLTLITAIPLALFLLILFIAIPQNNYKADAPAQTVLNAILQNETFQALFGDLTKTGTTGSSVDSGIVRLDTVGIREVSQEEILQVDTDYTGTLYLRGRALDTYDGKSWTDSRAETTDLYWPEGEQLESVGEVRIKTKFAHKMLYLPYYVQSMDLSDVTRGIENTTKLTDYSFTTALLRNESVLAKATGEIPQSYLQHLDDSTSAWASPLAEKITAGKTGIYEKAQAIAAYVRSSARYDLRTEAMPSYGRKDFAKWFLEESDTGYCVHFATAATVLLQAEGIPARYVTGYMTEVQENCVSLVRSCDAHAWVEYWLPGFGWTILEVTPSAQEEPETEPIMSESEPFDWGVVTVMALATLLAALVGAFVQRAIRLRLRRKRLRSGAVKQRVLAYWQECVRFATCLGELPDESLLHIAEKAKFSNHELLESDLAPFIAYLQTAREQIKRHGLFRKLYYRFVLALY
ncbi:MAG: transglutaminase domain-containing protein [Oscillospiraceae bacterium]|nr:transglutaminase domain-containing protein [Oscillospiraceae bacterium]